MFFFADNLLSFRTKKYRLDKLNLYQFFQQRIGINKTLSLRLSLYMGYSPYYNSKKVKKSSKALEVKQFLIDNSRYFDKNIKKLESSNIEKYLRNRSYKGTRHRYKYPTRGQRTRSNANTIRMVYRRKKHNKGKRRS